MLRSGTPVLRRSDRFGSCEQLEGGLLGSATCLVKSKLPSHEPPWSFENRKYSIVTIKANQLLLLLLGVPRVRCVVMNFREKHQNFNPRPINVQEGALGL